MLLEQRGRKHLFDRLDDRTTAGIRLPVAESTHGCGWVLRGVGESKRVERCSGTQSKRFVLLVRKVGRSSVVGCRLDLGAV